MSVNRTVFGLIAATLFALPSLATTKTVTIDRHTPINQYCPIDNREYDLTFIAEQTEVNIKIAAFNTTAGGTYIANRIDNIAIIDKASYDTHHVVPPGFEACYGAPGTSNAPALDFNASGTFERYLTLFDGNTGGWDLGPGATYQGGVSAPRNPALGTDTSGGALALGLVAAGNAVVSATLHLSNLTPGTQYVLTGWWYVKDTSRPLTITIDIPPCLDGDGDGVTNCEGDCDVHNPAVKPGAPEVCDGVDNDCDGQIDEDAPCDRVCDVPQVLLSDGRITDSAVGAMAPSLTWNGNRYSIFFNQGPNLVAEVYSDGSLVAPPHPPSPPAYVSYGLWTGTEYGSIGGCTGELCFTRRASDGTLISGPTLLSGSSGYLTGLQLAWNGSVYAAVWVTNSPVALKFQRINPTAVGSGSTVELGTAGTIGEAVIVAGGGSFGIVWPDRRDGAESELYFARFSSGGAKIGPDVRLTDAAGFSFDPVMAWSGSEWGIAWDDQRTGNDEIWFARVSSSGAKVGSDVQVSNAPGHSRFPAIVWAGGKYGIAWSDDRDGGNNEIYFTPIGCDCMDGDGDGFSSCVDCADGDASVYPGAPEPCTGVAHNCNTSWPIPLGVTDNDGDGFAPCQGDCDDAHASVYTGAPQICDGLNNDCADPSWPNPTGTDVDADHDRVTACAGDCLDSLSNVWATPGEVQSLLLAHNKSTAVTTLSWTLPSPGGTAPVFDTIRSSNPADFTTVTTCVEQNGGGDSISTDPVTPPVGVTRYYLVRAENACPGSLGVGPIGTDSQGVPRTARTCP